MQDEKIEKKSDKNKEMTVSEKQWNIIYEY